MKIAVAGMGYVGLSNAVLLSQRHEVVVLDIVKEKVEMLLEKRSPLADHDIQAFLENVPLDLTATTEADIAFDEAAYVVIATPTNYDPEKKFFDTSSVEGVIVQVLEVNPEAVIIVKSTVPVGWTEKMKSQYNTDAIIFSPEFLREGQALYDNLYPSRIVIGEQSSRAKAFANLLVEGARKEDIDIVYTDATEAEAIKLFANTYLAMRISFFNELDSYAELRDLDSKKIIEGIGYDPRIGMHYNNPSFGYGGYCLPKDTKQLLANYEDVPNNIMGAIVDANKTRKDHIAAQILSRGPKVVGIYRLTMKTGADNFRDSAVLGVMRRIQEQGIPVIVYEPSLDEKEFNQARVENNIEAFKEAVDIIVANRITKELSAVLDKVYTRDLYSRD
ncbi:nucleotide sugar dehydrogenase [Saliterribacillus persicus]|uniref:UDP-glucose 6-dehydrogenase n=1 Tax=Saliterribacillus persicus TaxID=930114 RepID=A0A368YAV3_9BACI|nr:nucleotide sugar dehydrogenase [Saliterribacillus persicus]RCW77332.1 UDPglucose 6-dehydrogenase [Saliterribacillus persicus]